MLHLTQVNFFYLHCCIHIFNRPNGKLPEPHSCHFLFPLFLFSVCLLAFYFLSFFAIWMRHYVGWLYLFSLLPSIPFITDQMREGVLCMCVCVRALGKMYCFTFIFRFQWIAFCTFIKICQFISRSRLYFLSLSHLYASIHSLHHYSREHM